MLNIVIAVLVYESLVALGFLLCWHLVRGMDTRLPIAATGPGDPAPVSHRGHRGVDRNRSPGLPLQTVTILLGACVLYGAATGASGSLGGLGPALLRADSLSQGLGVDPVLLRLVLPVGHFLILGGLFLALRRSVLFPAVLVHFLLIAFCLLVTLLDPGRIESVRLALVPVFLANLVLLIITHGLLTLLFCRSAAELAASLILAALAGGILALGTTVISLASTLLGGPLFFFQLYLVSSFGIFGLYFCMVSIALALWIRDERDPAVARPG
ncbi:MAG: hypothetical protein ACK4TJ_02450 [Tabrizicola sp.]